MTSSRRPGRGISRAWSLFWRLGYAWLRLTDPLIRAAWRSGGLGITVDLAVRGRVSGRVRRVLVGLIQVDDALVRRPPERRGGMDPKPGGRAGRDHRLAGHGPAWRASRAPGGRGGTRRGHRGHGRSAAVPGQPRVSGGPPPYPGRRGLLSPRTDGRVRRTSPRTAPADAAADQSRWYGTSATIVFRRPNRRSLSRRLDWLWSRFSHQWRGTISDRTTTTGRVGSWAWSASM